MQGWPFGPGDYGIFEDWSAINKSQEKNIRIKDRLISEGEVQDMKDEEFFYNEGPFFLGIPPGGYLSLLALVLPGRP